MPVDEAEFQIQCLRDQRLAIHATSALPAWLWSEDGTRILWANPAGAALFDAPDAAALSRRTISPIDRQRRQVARLAMQLRATDRTVLQRLSGFGASLGRLLTCACMRLEIANARTVLIAAAEPVGRTMAYDDRVRRLIEGLDHPLAAFAMSGKLIHANRAATILPGPNWTSACDLADFGFSQAARGDDESEATTSSGRYTLRRVGQGSDATWLIFAMTADMQASSTPPLQTPAAPEREEIPQLAEPVAEIVSAIETMDTDVDATAATAEPILAEVPIAQLPQDLIMAESAAKQPRIDEPLQPSPQADELPAARQHPLRFIWQMDAASRFSLGSDEFSRLLGPHIAAAFGRPWPEIAELFALDPEGKIATAIASHDTWSGLLIDWPTDGPRRLAVELSGLPVFDNTRQFAGYRGFGVCRDLEGLDQLAAQRRDEALHDSVSLPDHPKAPDDLVLTSSTETPVDIPPNVVPFRPAGESKTPPALTPVENSAFNEIARQLASRLEAERDELDRREKAASPDTLASTESAEEATDPDHHNTLSAGLSANDEPPRRAASDAPPQANSHRDALLYDRMPIGILVYRLDRLLYANRTFLARVEYDDLQALAAAGGLDALYVEPGVAGGSSTSDEGTPVKIAATGRDDTPTDARLHSISWDGDPAHALIFSAPRDTFAAHPPATPQTSHVEAQVAAPVAPADSSTQELCTILDATDDGILVFEADGSIVTCNRGAETLFGYDHHQMVQTKLSVLFATPSQAAVGDYLYNVNGSASASDREVAGLASNGDTLPLLLRIGRTTPGGRFFAICRRLNDFKQSESDALQTRRQTNRAANAKAELLTKISHEVRTPLNAIIGFCDVIIEERFGKLGNDRYAAYMKDIRAAGERVLSVLNDMTDLSRAETGNLDLTFARHDLNDMVERCVTIMQPQANRERIIIRTSLAHALPQVTADAAALRQIVLNLVGNSIHVARAGGQVIVSTALSDLGDVVLRIRDTGRGLNHTEMEAALEQFRNPSAEQLAQDNAGINLSLTRALVEANQAQFHIKSAPQSGTLVEVAFPPRAKAV